ncbi:MAG: ABC transporter ATP-binding protein, partial [Candidatus Sumerlaeia bacterium]|nr:ABC transporter ATP-binding protein [Candidatus Sumerlaeia bacterium]
SNTMSDKTTSAIETRGLGKRYRGKWVVKNLDLSIPKGCVYGFLGLNGSGKTTTIRMLLGLIDRDAGNVTTNGMDPNRERSRVLATVGYVPDAPLFHEWMTVGEIIVYTGKIRRSSVGGRWNADRAAKLVDRFDLDSGQRLGTLSKGQRARVSLLLALAFEPDVLLMDEPTGGLDPVMRRELLENVLAEYLEEGRTVLISSHLVNEISGLVDRVGILHDGALVRDTGTEELLASVKRVRLVHGDEAVDLPPITGLLRSRRRGRETLLAVNDFDSDRFHAEVKPAGVEGIVVEDMNLEDVFVEIVGGGGTP